MAFEILRDIKHRPMNGLTYSVHGRGYIQLTADWANKYVPKSAKFIVFYIDNETRKLGFKLHDELVPNGYRLNRNTSGGIQIKNAPLSRKLIELNYPANSEIFLELNKDVWELQR